MVASADKTIQLLARYVFSLARYDLDYDLRDKGRFLTSLLRGVAGGVYQQEGGEEEAEAQEGVVLRAAQVEHVLFEGRVVPKDEERWSGERFCEWIDGCRCCPDLTLAEQRGSTPSAPPPSSLTRRYLVPSCAHSLSGLTRGLTRPCVTQE